MIWSVSTSWRSSTEIGPAISCMGSIWSPAPDVDEMTLDGRRSGHLGRDEVRAPAATLAALEVAVRGRGAALARREDVRVHPEAHRATRRAPIEAGTAEHLVEALGLRLRLDLLRAGHDHRMHVRVHPAAVEHRRRRAEVADA